MREGEEDDSKLAEDVVCIYGKVCLEVRHCQEPVHLAEEKGGRWGGRVGGRE